MVNWKGLVYRMCLAVLQKLKPASALSSPEPCSSYLCLLLVSGPAVLCSPLLIVWLQNSSDNVHHAARQVGMKEASCSVVLETDHVPHNVPAIGPRSERALLRSD